MIFVSICACIVFFASKKYSSKIGAKFGKREFEIREIGFEKLEILNQALEITAVSQGTSPPFSIPLALASLLFIYVN